MALGYFTDSTPLTPLRNPFNALVDAINENAEANIVVGDLDDLAAETPSGDGATAYVVEGQMTFRSNSGAWVQKGPSYFASTGARDTAYSRASGTYLVAGAEARIGSSSPYVYTGSAWRSTSPIEIIAAASVSGVTNIDIDGLSGFDEYEIILNLPTASASSNLASQLRASGVVDSTTNYDYQSDNAADTTASATNGLAQTSWPNLFVGGRSDKFARIRIFGLNAAQRTVVQFAGQAFNPTANPSGADQFLRHRSGSSFDGIRFSASTGTVTGSYVVKGIRYS